MCPIELHNSSSRVPVAARDFMKQAASKLPRTWLSMLLAAFVLTFILVPQAGPNSDAQSFARQSVSDSIDSRPGTDSSSGDRICQRPAAGNDCLKQRAAVDGFSSAAISAERLQQVPMRAAIRAHVSGVWRYFIDGLRTIRTICARAIRSAQARPDAARARRRPGATHLH